MIRLQNIIEGVQDKGIFKAVFLAGGPGSGKTRTARWIFGIPDKFNISTVSYTHLRAHET